VVLAGPAKNQTQGSRISTSRYCQTNQYQNVSNTVIMGRPTLCKQIGELFHILGALSKIKLSRKQTCDSNQKGGCKSHTYMCVVYRCANVALDQCPNNM